MKLLALAKIPFKHIGHRMEARTNFGARLDTLVFAFYIETLNDTSQDVTWTMNDTRRTAGYLESSLLPRQRTGLPLKLNPFVIIVKNSI